MIEGFYTPNCCHILPSVVICAGACEDCGRDDWQITMQFLWWGFSVSWGGTEEEF